ncbi:MAG: hypothetical protein EBE86_026630 [Hormoscilla sp. GUM202]|nr:hypothetical protein [Hormoscilla sp. GM7CHS1pb]MBO1350725.1 hypothetical protein [Hormoscilla sp. GUM202]
MTNVEVAIAFTKPFWPDAIEHEGGIFRSSGFDRHIYDRWKATLGNDITSIEQVMNHRHIDDILPPIPGRRYGKYALSGKGDRANVGKSSENTVSPAQLSGKLRSSRPLCRCHLPPSTRGPLLRRWQKVIFVLSMAGRRSSASIPDLEARFFSNSQPTSRCSTIERPRLFVSV